MTPIDPALMEAGRLMFAREWTFRWAAQNLATLPPMEGIEIAFAGRSNVGKSSLINALTGRNGLCRTSQTPGRTQQLNFFRADDSLAIIDMPGYGYAAVGKQAVANWTQLILSYLSGRANLARVFVLIDARHGIKDTDTPVLDLMDKSAVSWQVVLTKADTVKGKAREETLAKVRAAIARRPAAHPDILVTSGETREGIEEMRGVIAGLMADRRA
jgi:GTP-binding protein